MLGILAAALQLGCIVRSWELILFANTASRVVNGEEELEKYQSDRSDLLRWDGVLWGGSEVALA